MASIAVMITVNEKSTLLLYGFYLPVYSKWLFSDSFDIMHLSYKIEPIYKPSSKLTPARPPAVHSPLNSQSNCISNWKQNSVLSLLLSAAIAAMIRIHRR
ncbi:hypothetical protein L1987_87325 [Smallanthus sonchifolius]|nr:hypothetical protein L1987_87325 [Smallanthus sonchifolius]